MFTERVHGFGLRNALALALLLASAALVFTHSAGADDPTFAPTVSLQTSTTRAAAHPDARITIDNSASTEAIKDITLDLPDGMVGSLNAADQCTVSQAQAENCPSSSKVGTVTNYARVDNSDAVLRGSVYLTEALPPHDNDDPAGLQIVVPAKIGGVNMGTVVVNARVQIRYSATGSVLGVRTLVTDVPREITDANNRTVQFSLDKLVVDLRSDQVAPRSKLLTNSSRCRTAQISIFATGYDSSSIGSSEDYTTTQCAQVHFGDAEAVSFVPTSAAAGTQFTFTSSIEMPDDQPSLNSVVLQMPGSVSVYSPGVGEPDDQCPISSIIDDGTSGENVFNPADCPEQAKVGTVEVETPLLPDPLVGDFYLIEASPIPNIGFFVDPTTGPDNPAGVSFGVAGVSSTPNIGGLCSPPPPGGCRTSIATTFSGLPDVPIKKITVNGDPATRTGVNSSLSGNILKNTTSSDPSCQPNSDVAVSFTSWVGVEPESTTSTRAGSGITSYPLSGCNARNLTITGSPYGGYAASNTPTLAYADATQSTAACGVDRQTGLTNCDPVLGAGSYVSPALDEGIHFFFTKSARPNGEPNWRTFAVPVDPPTDTIAPEVTLGTVPSDPTSDTTPSVDFTSDEDAYFQCSLDSGPFLPCDSAVTDPASSGGYTVPSALIPNTTEHTIRVRAQDAAGNTSSIESTTFKVEVALDPTFDVFKPGTETPGLSTEVARAHPEMDIRVTSGSHEDIKNLQLKMPRGLLGGLTAVPTICPLADAQDALCTDDSMVGTVDTEAVVDESTVRISGKVYMTTPIVLGDPAGLMVDVHAKIQDIDDGHVLVPIRLAVAGPRVGNAVTDIEGIESFATDLPQSIDPSLWGNTYDTASEFDLRSMTLKLRNNPSASQPLLTNPSECTPDNFEVSFEGYDGTDVAKSTPNIDWTGCGALGFGTSVSMSMVDIETGQPPVERSNSYIPKTTFTTDLTMDPNGSSIKNATVLLPKNVTANVGELPAPCPVATYQTGGADACPASTIMGSVSATSPLLRAPLEGKVYILKSNVSLPKLVLALRGPINTDIIGDMVFENITQIRTTFASSPDAPISSLHLVVNRIISTRDDACSYGPDQTNAISTFNAYNGKSATNANALPVTCIGSGSAKFSYKKGTKKQKNRSTLSLTLRAPTGTKYTSVQVEFPKGISMVKSGFKKGLRIKSGSSKLKYSCGKAKKSNRFTSTLCKKPNMDISLSWGAGSIKAKKVKKPTFKVTAVDSLGRTHVFSVRSSK